MPNGVVKTWVRFCAAVDGFYLEFGQWPTRVRTFPVALDDLRSLFRNESFYRITAKLKLVPGGSPFVTEDEEGHAYSYGDRVYLLGGFEDLQNTESDHLPCVYTSTMLGLDLVPHDALK